MIWIISKNKFLIYCRTWSCNGCWQVLQGASFVEKQCCSRNEPNVVSWIEYAGISRISGWRQVSNLFCTVQCALYKIAICKWRRKSK